MKKTMKIVSILLVALLMISIATSVFAVQPNQVNIDTTDAESVNKIGGRIIGIIQIVGNIVAIAMLVVIGIKYMMGSAEEKAEYKKTLFPYFVGAILIFAASNLAQMVYTWAHNITA